MTDFRIVTNPAPVEQSSVIFAVGAETGSLYVVRHMPHGVRLGNGIAIIGKNGIRTGSDHDLRLEEILPRGTVIEITT